MRILYLILVLVTLALTACGDTPQDKKEQAEKRIKKINAIQFALEDEFGIILNTDNPILAQKAGTLDSNRDYSLEDLNTIEARLLQLSRLTKEVLDIENGDDRVTFSKKQKPALKRIRSNAAKCLEVVRERRERIIEAEDILREATSGNSEAS